MVTPFALPLFRAVDASGVPLSGGKLYTYDNGTTTPAVTYQDSAGTIPNLNPVVLDARGEAIVFLQADRLYTLTLKDEFDVLVWSLDGVSGITSSVEFGQLKDELTDGLGTPDGSFVQSFAGAVKRSQLSKDRDTVSLADFGVHGDGSTADLDKIMRALATGAEVWVPPGLYLIPGTIEIGLRQRMRFSNGVTFRASYVGIKPMIRIVSSYASITGNGYPIFETPNATGNGGTDPTMEGIINVGSRNLTQELDISFVTISGIKLMNTSGAYEAFLATGDTTVDDYIGLKLVNSQAFLGSGKGSLYNSTFSEILTERFGVGIDCGPVVQGNYFKDLNAYRISLAAFRQTGCNENFMNGMFVHSSPGVTFIQLKSLPSDHPWFPNRRCFGNSFTDIEGEPGPTAPNGRFSRFCDLDVLSDGNYLQGYGNTGHAYIDLGTNTIIDRGRITTRITQVFNADVAMNAGTTYGAGQKVKGDFGVAAGNKVVEFFARQFTPADPVVPQTAFVVVSTGGANNVIMVRFSLVSASSASSSIGRGDFIYVGRTSASASGVMTGMVYQIGGTPTFTITIEDVGNASTVKITPAFTTNSRFLITAEGVGVVNFTLT